MALKRTPLYEAHTRLGAKLVEFGGWEMPIQYTSIIEEHTTVRAAVGIFDVSHMGELEITGPNAHDLVQKLITNDASTLKEYQVLYSPMCYESGGTVDDLLVYKLPDRFLLVVNAANTDKDFAWVQQNAKNFKVTVKNVSAEYGQIAVQGPQAERLLQPFTACALKDLRYYWATPARVLGSEVLLSRTGYTGEDGFEIYAEPSVIVRLWDELIRAGAKPIGLGARDTLRFESGMPLYGHELDEQTTPVEAGLGWTVKEKDIDYNGKAILLAQKHQGPKKKLIGLKMLEPGVPRQGYKIFADGREVGAVTSGMFAPSVNAFLAMGFVAADIAATAALEIEIRGQRKKAQMTKLPFYRGSVKR
ncbi:MAG: glycine cleavage system aminomethyltransferase GcvT [Candidatus Bipolaricaulota bacterium]|nr:glycine cleavage system aminomethyltransferase GcvT [Candidatus Bipolaricaulota bacterium]